MHSKFSGRPAVIIGTGPSLADQADAIRKSTAVRFGVNNTFNDFTLDVWIACDPQWHETYSPVKGEFEKWHWDEGVCRRYGYQYIPGRWADGLSLDPGYIHYNHSSSAQALNLAVLYGCSPIYLAGFDMNYSGRRHYFDNLSEKEGEYPAHLRKYSEFDGLIECFEKIAAQPGLPPIFNLTEHSALSCFPFRGIECL